MLLLLLPMATATTTDALLAEGMRAQKAGEITQAKAAYSECLAQVPNHVRCHWEIGWSYWSTNEWDQVIVHWERVGALDPSHAEVGKWLPQAREQHAAIQEIRAEAGQAPTSVRPPLSPDKTIRIRAVGDIMMGTDFPHPTNHLPAGDGSVVWDGVRALLADADLTFGNLEGPLCDSGTTEKCSAGSNCYAFRTPTRYVSQFSQAGFDMMSTANNHANDFGPECRLETEQTLEKAGIAYSGRPGTIATVEVGDVRVGMLGFHTWNHCYYLNDHETAALVVKQAAAEHDILIVSFHGGAEGSKSLHVPDHVEKFYGENRGHLRKFVRVVLDAGADLVLGHGPHVPRGLEVINGHLVAYSLGNFATYDRFNLSGHLGTSLILEVSLDHKGKLVSGQILPMRLEGRGVPAPDPEATAVDLIRSLSVTDFGANAPIIAQDGSFAPR